MANDDLAALIRTIPDFPRPGILFRDVTTLLLSAHGFRTAVERMVAAAGDGRYELVAGIEARGFLFAAAMAGPLGAGVLPVRKAGKLPGAVLEEAYALEYGEDRIAVHADAVAPGARVLLVDDLLATGGTACAAARLIRRAGGVVERAVFLVDLPDLGGADTLRGAGVEPAALVAFAGH